MGKHSKEPEKKSKKNKIKNNNKNDEVENEKINNKKRNQDTDSIENNKKNNKKRKHKTLKRVVIIILIIIIALATYLGTRIAQNGGGMRGIVSTLVGTSSEQVKNLDDIYMLILGKSQNMTDTIMVVKYSPKNQQASLLSIPRDSFVGKSTSSATAFDKINSKYQISPQSVIDAVNRLTGLNLKYYVTVDTKALRDLVDAIGGVYFDVPIDMDYDDSSQALAIHLKKGYQLLNGMQAEGVVRFRHNNNGTSYPSEYGDNDLGRMKTQRAFIETVLKQTLKVGNITKVNQLINIAKEEVSTNIPWDTLKNYAVALMDFDTNNLKTGALPGAADYYNGLSFFIVNTKQSKEMVNDLFFSTGENANDISSSNTISGTSTSGSNKSSNKNRSKIKLEVLNGTGSSDRFNNAITQLKDYGYNITKKGTTNFTNKTVIIDRKSNSNEEKNELKSLLCTGTTTVGEDNSNVDFTIIIGIDY